MENVIQISNLSKSFGEIEAVKNLSFCVKRGELFAFLGVNGAGKSTTINILSGQLAYDSGEVQVCGLNIDKDSAQIKSRLGVVFQSSVLDSPLSVYDNLRSRAALYGIVGEDFKKRLSELSDMLELEEIMKRSVGKLSGGQRRRADIARALLHRPEILILDEPTTGLDPKSRKILWQTVEKLRREENMTVFLTTHYMEEAADADYVIILDGGKIAAEGTPIELKNRYTGDFITLYGCYGDEALAALGVDFERGRELVRISVPSTRHATELILKNPTLFSDYEIRKGRMDDVFLEVTGKKLSEEDVK